MKSKYDVDTELETLPYNCSAWLVGDQDKFDLPVQVVKTKDKLNRPVILFRTAWDKDYTAKKCPDHQFEDMA